MGIQLTNHTVVCACTGSVDFERKYGSADRTRDASPALLPDLPESVSSPDHSSGFHYDDGYDDDVAAEDGDSKEEVHFVTFSVMLR